MVILKEINKIKSELERQTGNEIVQVCVETSDKLFVLWCYMYDKQEDNSYWVKFESEISTLTQYSNEYIIKEIIRSIHEEWAKVAVSNVTIH